MKKFKFLAMLLLGSLISFGNISCSDDDDDEPAQNIKAVGFNTEKPVKRIVQYDYSTNQPLSAMTFTWSGKNITSVTLSQVEDKGKAPTDVLKREYKYQGKQIICHTTERNMETGKMEDSDLGNPVIQLDEFGYAQSYSLEREFLDYVSDKEGVTKEVKVKEVVNFKVERDETHRVTKEIRTSQKIYTPEDLAMQGLDKQPEPDTQEYKFFKDEKGNISSGIFNFEYTDNLNKNGFFPAPHGYSNHMGNITHDLPMGPYDLFQIETSKYLPNNLGHEIYRYKFDADGYVTKVYDCRNSSDGEYCNYYSVFEY